MRHQLDRRVNKHSLLLIHEAANSVFEVGVDDFPETEIWLKRSQMRRVGTRTIRLQMGRKILNGQKLNKLEWTQLKQIMFTSRVSSSWHKYTAPFLIRSILSWSDVENRFHHGQNLLSHLFKMTDVIDIIVSTCAILRQQHTSSFPPSLFQMWSQTPSVTGAATPTVTFSDIYTSLQPLSTV